MSQWGHIKQYHLLPLHIQRLAIGHGVMLCSFVSLAIKLSMHCEQSHDMTGIAVGRANMPACSRGMRETAVAQDISCVCALAVYIHQLALTY